MSSALVEALTDDQATVTAQYTLIVTWSIIITGSFHLIFGLVAVVAGIRRSGDSFYSSMIVQNRYFDWVSEMSSAAGHQRLIVADSRSSSSSNMKNLSRQDDQHFSGQKKIDGAGVGSDDDQQLSGAFSANGGDPFSDNDDADDVKKNNNDISAVAAAAINAVAASNAVAAIDVSAISIEGTQAPISTLSQQQQRQDSATTSNGEIQQQQQPQLHSSSGASAQDKLDHLSGTQRGPAAAESRATQEQGAVAATKNVKIDAIEPPHYHNHQQQQRKLATSTRTTTAAVHTSTRFTQRRSLYLAATEALAAAAAQQHQIHTHSKHFISNSSLCLASLHRAPSSSETAESPMQVFLVAWWPLVVLVVYATLGIVYAFLRCTLIGLGIALVYNALGIAMNTEELVIYTAVLVIFAMAGSLGRVTAMYAL